MSGKGDSGPKYPDPSQLIDQQAKANRITQYTPNGNFVYGTVGSNGQFQPGQAGGTATLVQATPFQRNFQAGQEGIASRLQGLIQGQDYNLPVADFGGLPKLQWQVDWNRVGQVPQASQFAAQSKQAQDAVYNRAMENLRPDLEQQDTRLRQGLADRGLPIGSEAYTNELNRLDRSKAQQLNDLALAAVDAGNQEQQRNFGNALTVRGQNLGDQLQAINLANQARQTGYGERQSQRTQALQELAASLGGAYNPTPGTAFIPPSQIDVSGPYNAAYAAQQNAYQNRQNRNSGLLGGLFNLGSAALPFAFA